MPSHLLAITVGPVQGFIAAARRTRDLWMGSHILSEVSKAVALNVKQKSQAELIFPAPDGNVDPDSDFNVANVVLCVLPAERQPRTVAAEAKGAAHTRWQEFAQRAYDESKSDIDLDRWRRQFDVKDIVEFYAAWVPFTEQRGYPSARRQVMRLLAGRKACRDFPPANGLDATIPKSSLDGARESVLIKVQQAGERRRSGLWTRAGEQLDIVGVTKRAEFGHDAIRYVSVSRIAAEPWLAGVAQVAAQSENMRAAFESLTGHCEQLSHGDFRLLRQRKEYDLDEFPFLREFPWEGTAVYRQRHNELIEDCPRPTKYQGTADRQREFDELIHKHVKQLGELVKKLEKEFGFGEPGPYLVVLAADGDRMGATLSELETVDQHRQFSSKQAAFASQARKIVQEHDGATVYAGGDDVLAFVPLHRCLECARTLYDTFGQMITEAVPPEVLKRIAPPTLSIGLAIGHFMEPLEDLRQYAQAAEKAAKGTDRNGLAIAIHTRGGAPFTVREQWQAGDKQAQSMDRRLLRWTSLFQTRQLPSKAAYDLRHLAREYEAWPATTSGEKDVLARAVSADALRVLVRKIGAGDEEVKVAKQEIKELVRNVANAQELLRLAEQLLVAQRLAAARDQAEGRHTVAKTEVLET